MNEQPLETTGAEKKPSFDKINVYVITSLEKIKWEKIHTLEKWKTYYTIRLYYNGK